VSTTCNDSTVSSERERRGAIDIARSGALVLVVIGHLTLAVIDRGPDGSLRGVNLVALHPGWYWLTALAPMPIFFAAAGFANSSSSLTGSAQRLRTIVGLGAVVVGVWSLASMIELAVRGDGGIVADGARIATQPLWFLAAYVPFTAVGSRLATLARQPVLVIIAALSALTAIDVARFVGDAPRWIGWPGFFLAWGIPWLLGAWWRQRSIDWRLQREQRVGIGLAVSAIAVCVALVEWGGYSPALIDAVPGRRSNTTPPTLFTAFAGITQVGVLMVVASPLDRVADRARRALQRAATISIGIYVWHLTALSLCAAVLAAGVRTPTRLSLSWWLTRPLWFALVLGVTVALTRTTRLAQRPRRKAGATEGDSVAPRHAVLAVVLATIGAAVVGVIGPRTPAGAISGTIGFASGWWFLRATSQHRRSAAGQ